MQQSQQYLRISLAELKAQIVKKLGPERSKRYFYCLNRLLSQKLRKFEFDQLCLQILGRENLPLHNQFIRSILKNACQSKTPPTVFGRDILKSTRAAGKKSPSEDGYQQKGPSLNATQAPNLPIWSNGDVLPFSPRKGRSGIRNHRLKDHPSPAGPNVKTEFASHQHSVIHGCNVKAIVENGDLSPCDYQRPTQQYQGLAGQPDDEQAMSLQCPTKRPRIKGSHDCSPSVHSKGNIEAVAVKDGEEVEQAKSSDSHRSPVHAPLGIPFCSASVGGARRSLPVASGGNFCSCFDSCELYDTHKLRKRMEQIAGEQGLGGVPIDCANLLNSGLNAYLKQMIKSCVELVGARSGHELTKQPTYKQKPHGKLINGVWPNHRLQMQSNSGSLDGMQEQRSHSPITLLDFKVAMELNPQQLGEDWPLLLEKICMQAFEE